jgi:IMP dehydrogenase
MDAMKSGKGSRERYSQGNVADMNKLVPQGVEAIIPYKGSVLDVLHQYAGGVRFSLGYCGARTIRELQQKVHLVRVSSAGVQEAHPHAVKIIKDAPNYSAN